MDDNRWTYHVETIDADRLNYWLNLRGVDGWEAFAIVPVGQRREVYYRKAITTANPRKTP